MEIHLTVEQVNKLKDGETLAFERIPHHGPNSKDTYVELRYAHLTLCEEIESGESFYLTLHGDKYDKISPENILIIKYN